MMCLISRLVCPRRIVSRRERQRPDLRGGGGCGGGGAVAPADGHFGRCSAPAPNRRSAAAAATAAATRPQGDLWLLFKCPKYAKGRLLRLTRLSALKS